MKTAILLIFVALSVAAAPPTIIRNITVRFDKHNAAPTNSIQSGGVVITPATPYGYQPYKLDMKKGVGIGVVNGLGSAGEINEAEIWNAGMTDTPQLADWHWPAVTITAPGTITAITVTFNFRIFNEDGAVLYPVSWQEVAYGVPPVAYYGFNVTTTTMTQTWSIPATTIGGYYGTATNYMVLANVSPFEFDPSNAQWMLGDSFDSYRDINQQQIFEWGFSLVAVQYQETNGKGKQP